LAGNHGFCRGKAAGSSQIKLIHEPAALPLHCDSRLIRESRKRLTVFSFQAIGPQFKTLSEKEKPVYD